MTMAESDWTGDPALSIWRKDWTLSRKTYSLAATSRGGNFRSPSEQGDTLWLAATLRSRRYSCARWPPSRVRRSAWRFIPFLKARVALRTRRAGWAIGPERRG